MEGVLRTLRWTLAARALLAIAIGAACLGAPARTMTWLVVAFGAYAIAEGVLVLSAAAVLRWSALLLQAVASIMIGAAALTMPDRVEAAAGPVLGGWAILVGLLQLAAAARLRELLAGEWMLGLAGTATALAGLAIVMQPDAALVRLVWVICAWALVVGVVMLGLVWRLTHTSVRM